jgi:hypothetical protein
MSQSIHVRCRFCEVVLPGWLRIDNKPNGAMLLNHLSAMHPAEVGPYLRRMTTEDIGTVAMEAYERVEGAERLMGFTHASLPQISGMR